LKKKTIAKKTVRSKLKKSSGVKSEKIPTKTALKIAEALVQAVWPMERDFFERPDRFTYVRKLVPTVGCVFCLADQKSKEVESLCLFKDETSMIILNKYPYNTGHLLVLPRRHVGDLAELREDENVRIAGLVKLAVEILKKVYNCGGFNIGVNHGAAAGAGIPDHLHWHIVPRWAGDTNFFPLIAQTKVLPETVLQTYDKLKEPFSRIK
jgi:ATP adenylyltransferase